MPTKRIGQLFLLIFSLIWMFVIGIDYFNKHPFYSYSIEYFRFPKYLIASLFHVLVLIWLNRFLSNKVLPRFLLVIPLLVQIVISVLAFKNFSATQTTISHCLTLVSGILSVSFILALMTIIFANCGRRISNLGFIGRSFNSRYFVDIGLGIMVYTFGLFILGSFGLLSAITVLLLFLLMILVNPIQFWMALKDIVGSKINFTLNSASIFLFFVLVTHLIINFVSTQAPFPDGFDSRNVYLNISNLIGQKGELISGFPPYNWSLFITTGFLLFDWQELSIALSFYGYLLALAVIFYLAKDVLKLSKTQAILSMLIVTVTPAITNQLNIEYKVDYGLLFFQLLASYIFFENYQKLLNFDFKIAKSRNVVVSLILILGAFVGFGLGIKMINLFLVVAFISLIWFNPKENFGFIGALCFTLALLLIAQIDDVSGLSDYHLKVERLQIFMLLLSLLMFLISLFKDRVAFIKRLVVTVSFLACSGLFLSPWLIRNFIETKSLNPKVLIAGESTGVDLNTKKILKNYRESKK